MKPRTLTVILLLLGILLHLNGCSSGGEGSDREGDSDGTPPPQTTLSGSMLVPPNHMVESEPNDRIDQAQPLTAVSKVSGSAAVTDDGFELRAFSGTLVQDLYLLEADDAVRIFLTIAADDLMANDLDLLLMNLQGEVLDTSEGQVAVEDLDTEQPGSFLVGVRAARGTSAYLLSLEPLGSLGGGIAAIPADADFVPGEILVKTLPRTGDKAVLQVVEPFGLRIKERYPGGITLMQIDKGAAGEGKLLLQPQSALSLREETLDRVRQLRREPEVVYAEPNYLRHPQAVPDDQFYDLQWHYRLINLPQAWDRTTGSGEVVMAVLDTGVLFDHPDLQGRLLPGFDFISDPVIANDGDGIDADAGDAGDDSALSSSSFHGTHVAGVAGALSDNSTGVAGTTWAGSIMPLRVLGVGGGTVADIAQAIRYAAGLVNSSGTFPEIRATVINMSFGSPGFSFTVNDAVQDARDAGVVLVSSAGNDNDSDPFYPASYSGVISVAAVDLNSQKAFYSNFGPHIDLAAPGGDTSRDLNSDGFFDGVLSTHGNDAGDFFYRFLAGTSMAAPHVTGTIGLMASVYPQLTPHDVDLLIAGTHPLTSIQIVRDIGREGRDDLFGHGIVDASLAVQAAEALAGGGGVSGSMLSLSTSILDFQDYLTTTTFEVSNGGSGTLEVIDISDDAEWLTVTPTAGTAPLTVHVTVDRSGLAAGTYSATVTVSSDAFQGSAQGTVEVVMEVGTVLLGNVGTIFVHAVDQATLEPVSVTQTEFADGYSFTISGIDPGTYLITAGTDRDDDSVICEIEDACGNSAELITVEEGQSVEGVEFPVSESSAPQSRTGTTLLGP